MHFTGLRIENIDGVSAHRDTGHRIRGTVNARHDDGDTIVVQKFYPIIKIVVRAVDLILGRTIALPRAFDGLEHLKLFSLAAGVAI